MFRQLISKQLLPTLERDLSHSIQKEFASWNRMTDPLFAPHVSATVKTSCRYDTIVRPVSRTVPRHPPLVPSINVQSHPKEQMRMFSSSLERDLSYAVQTEFASSHQMNDALFAPHISTSTCTQNDLDRRIRSLTPTAPIDQNQATEQFK